MTLHYHGTPITPITALYELAGRCFCVSFAAKQDAERCHQIGQSVMLDNGAFSLWRRGLATDWPGYYAWVEQWLEYPTTWAVIPDLIDGGELAQDELIKRWPFGHRGAPVWHLDEPLDRLVRLCDEWPKVCMGSTAEYAEVLSEAWQRRVDQAFDQLSLGRRFLPWIHMLRGMACCGLRWPFASVDSTDIGRNHNRDQNTPRKLADRWDKMQCPASWQVGTKQEEMFA
jgi:hypothetical protein